MTLPSERPATYQDILDLPEMLVGEIIHGRMMTHPRLTGKALFAKGKLAGVLANQFGLIASAQTSIDDEQDT